MSLSTKDKKMRNLKQSLCVEDFLRQVFLVPLTGENLDELLNLTQDFVPKLKEHKLILEQRRCRCEAFMKARD